MELQLIILIACFVVIAFMFVTAYFYNNRETFENYYENDDPFYSSNVSINTYQDVLSSIYFQSIRTI